MDPITEEEVRRQQEKLKKEQAMRKNRFLNKTR